MGNTSNIEPFKERKFESLDQHINKYINKYGKYYSDSMGLSDSETWDYILSIDLNGDCFTKLEQINQELLVLILELSLDISFNKRTNISIRNNFVIEDNPILILEYWYECGILNKLENLYEKNNYDLDFSSMHCAQGNNISTIGSSASYLNNNSDFTKLIIPFKNDKFMHLCICSSG